MLNRLRTSTPAWSRRAKNSSSLFAEAAAVATCRRSVTLGGSSRPRRGGLSLFGRGGRGGGGGHLPSQRDPRGLVQATAGGLLVLGAGRPAGRGAVGGGGGAQPVALLSGQAGGADLDPFPGQAGLSALLAGQHGGTLGR